MARSSIRTHDRFVRSPPTRLTIGVGMALAFACTWLFRWVTVAFVNDHFTHLSRARQIVGGELPIRDFFDPGQFLHYYVSASAQVVFGDNLFGEAVLTITFIAVAAALACGLATRLSGSWVIGAAVTLLGVISSPRLYNYPKVFLYVAALGLGWRYARRPTRPGVGLLAAMTVLAFLFRYDHGFYIGFFMAVLLTLVHIWRPREWISALSLYAGVSLVLLLPFLAYVQWAAGLLPYARAVLIPARTIATSIDTRRTLLFEIERSHGLVEVVSTSRVLDALPGQAFWRAIDRRIPLFRTRLAPGVFSEHNALVWFYDVTVAIPFIALLLSAFAWWRGRIERAEGAAIAAIACLCLLISRTLLSDNPEARLADIALPIGVLGAWVTGRVLTGAARGLVLRRAVFASLFVATLWSIALHSAVVPTLGHALRSLEWHPIATVSSRLRARPIDSWAPPGQGTGIVALGRYVWRCTAPSDRLLVGGAFAPEAYFYTGRLFAAGQVHFMPGWHATEPEQRRSLEWLSRQSVPIALIGPEPLFPLRFNLVAAHLDTRYVEVARSTFGGDVEWRVLADRSRTATGTDRLLGLPCYATAPQEHLMSIHN